MLRFHHVANREFREFDEWLHRAVGWRRRNSVAEGINQNDEVFVGVDNAAGSDEREQIFGSGSKPGGPENGIGSCGVQLAEGAIAETEIVQNRAALQSEVAERGELLRAVIC